MRLFSLSVVALLAGCASRPPSREVSAANAAPAAAPVVVLQPRLCAERHVRRQGEAPLRRDALASVAAHRALTRALPGLGRPVPVAQRCEDLTDVAEGDPRALRASGEALAAMRANGGRSVLVTEVVAQVTCGGREPLRRDLSPTRGYEMPHCYEGDVRVVAFLFGEDGRLLWARRHSVPYAEDADAAVADVISRAPVQAIAAPCRVAGSALDCT